MTLGDVIKSYRDENKVSMEYVANLCGITKGYVAMLEKNVNSKTGRPVKPTIETIVKVCNGLHLDFNSVFNSLDDDYEINISTSQPSSSAPTPELTEQEKHIISIYHDLDRVGQEKFTAFGEGLLAAARAEDGCGYYTFTPYENCMVAESGSEYQMWSNKVNDQLMEDADRISKKEIENVSDTKKMVK